MSVNLPFILIAVAQLSLPDAQLIALVSSAAQCFPKGGKVKALQMLFNLSAVAVAVGIGNCILQPAFAGWAPGRSTSLLLALAGTTFFLVQTIPVATIISLTEGGRVLRIWSSIFILILPLLRAQWRHRFDGHRCQLSYRLAGAGSWSCR